MDFTNTKIFAYARRSTKQDSQANSLFQQSEHIERIAEKLQINPKQIIPFAESISAYDDKTRPEWARMLKEIDKEKEPVVLLCRETSRLSRNEEDNLNITSRLFGKHKFKNKQKIKSIFFLDTNGQLSEWNNQSDQGQVAQTLLNHFIFSVNNGKNSRSGIIGKLLNGEYPYSPPAGLERVTLKGELYNSKTTKEQKTILRTNDKILFIQKAFEMRAQGLTTKEICRYLRKYGKISTTTSNICKDIFRNTIYIGYYTDKKTGEIYELKYKGGVPPISKALFKSACDRIGKQGSGSRDGQKEHLAQGKFKHEETGKNLYLYKAKGKFYTYGTDFKHPNGKRTSICKSEKEILKEFLDELRLKLDDLLFEIDNEIDYGLNERLKYYEGLYKERDKYFLLEIQKMDKEDEQVLKEYCKIKGLKEQEVKKDAELYNTYYIWKLYENQRVKERLQKEKMIDILEMQKIFYIWGVNYKKYIHLDYEEQEYILGELQEEIMKKCEKDKQFERKQRLGEIQRRNSDFVKDIDKKIEKIEVEIDKDLFIKHKNLCSKIEQRKNKYLLNILNATPQAQIKQKELEVEHEQKELLLQEKSHLEEEIKGADLKYAKLGYGADVAQAMKKELFEQIQDIEMKLETMKENENFEEFLQRIPEVINNLHELARNTLNNAENQAFREQVKELMQFTLHELTLNNKKALKIRLFEALEHPENIDFSNGAIDRTRTCDLLLRREAF